MSCLPATRQTRLHSPIVLMSSHSLLMTVSCIQHLLFVHRFFLGLAYCAVALVRNAQDPASLHDSQRCISDWPDARPVSWRPGERMPCSVPAAQNRHQPGEAETDSLRKSLLGRLLQEQHITTAGVHAAKCSPHYRQRNRDQHLPGSTA